MKIFSLKSINFGKKIPIKTCKILDKKQGNLVDATIYEHDCKDLSDAYEVHKLDKFFAFKELFVSGMHRKFLNQKIGLETQEHYYSLQNSNGEILGCCRTLENKDINLNISLNAKKYILSKGTDLKYGARPLRRAIQRYVEDEIAEKL